MRDMWRGYVVYIEITELRSEALMASMQLLYGCEFQIWIDAAAL